MKPGSWFAIKLSANLAQSFLFFKFTFSTEVQLTFYKFIFFEVY